MIGLGILFRVFRPLLGKRLESSGVLPTRYYLQEILKSLNQDNIGEAVKLLGVSRGALLDKSRWELVRQQVLFRCRVLIGRHRRRICSIENRIIELGGQSKLPWRWFQKRPVKNLAKYETALRLEKRARALLERYEIELKSICERS